MIKSLKKIKCVDMNKFPVHACIHTNKVKHIKSGNGKNIQRFNGYQNTRYFSRGTFNKKVSSTVPVNVTVEKSQCCN